MTAEPINLRRARKAKARAERERGAAQNRIAFGRSKAERQKAAAEHRLLERAIEGHRRAPEKD